MDRYCLKIYITSVLIVFLALTTLYSVGIVGKDNSFSLDKESHINAYAVSDSQNVDKMNSTQEELISKNETFIY